MSERKEKMSIKPVSTEGLLNATNEEIADAYLHHIEIVKKMAQRSVTQYGYTIGDWIRFVGDAPLNIVHPTHVEEFARRPRRNGLAASAHTIRREIIIVRGFHTWANEYGYDVPTVTTAVTPKLPQMAPKPIPDDLWLEVWKSDLEDDARLMLGLGYFCGLRRIEMVTLGPESVDPQRGWIEFTRKGNKTTPIEYREMVRWAEKVDAPVADGAQDWIDLLERTAAHRLQIEANLLWWEGNQDASDDVTRLAKRFNKWLKRAGVGPNAFTPHQLRHSCATNLLRAGLDLLGVAEQLSHSDTKVTRNYLQTSGHLRRQYENRYGKVDFDQ